MLLRSISAYAREFQPFVLSYVNYLLHLAPLQRSNRSLPFDIGSSTHVLTRFAQPQALAHCQVEYETQAGILSMTSALSRQPHPHCQCYEEVRDSIPLLPYWNGLLDRRADLDYFVAATTTVAYCS